MMNWDSMMLRRITRHALIVPLALGMAYASPLDDRIKAFRAAATQNEADVAEILKTGLTEQRSAEAFAATRAWLTANPSESATLLFQAAKAAEFAGEWNDALSFYGKFLKLPNPDTAMAGEATTSAYRLLINHLGDPDAAYLFMREDGDRLRVYGRARQFDAWFIAQAKVRKDVPALCNRLVAIIGADAANVAPHTADIEWVCAALETFTPDSDTWLPAAGKLAALPSLPDPYKARIDWVMAIVPFSNEAGELFRAKKPIPDALFDKPMQAADALVAALPFEGSLLVARGWMNFRDGHTPNLVDYLAVRREVKTAPILKALAGLSTQQVQALFAAPGCPQGRPVSLLFSTADLRALAVKTPAVFNSLAAPNVSLYDNKLTVEEAKALAPLLTRNPHPDAALVRAFATTGAHRFTALAAAVVKSEMWRFPEVKSAVNTLWNSGAERDTNQADAGKLQDKPDARAEQIAKQIAKEAASKDRLAAFNTLQGDLSGATPSILLRWCCGTSFSPPRPKPMP